MLVYCHSITKQERYPRPHLQPGGEEVNMENFTPVCRRGFDVSIAGTLPGVRIFIAI